MDYHIAIRDVAEQPIVSIRGRGTTTDLTAHLGRSFEEIYARLAVLGVGPAGPPVVIYHAFGPDEIDAEVCVPLGTPVRATGRVVARTLPAATVAWTLHVGPYDDLGAAHDAVTDWVRDRGHVAAGPPRELYLNGPDEGIAPAAYRTEIEMPIVAAPAAVARGRGARS
jgi:effector-binding domain-containing protein